MLTHPLDSIAQAQEHNRSGRTRGKVLVDMGAAPIDAGRSHVVPKRHTHDSGSVFQPGGG